MGSQQTQVSTTGNKGGSPGACPGQQSNTALQELQTLEQICVSAVLSNLRLLQDHCMDGVPDYLRFQLFESIRAKNPLLLHGKILRAIVSGAHFEELDLKHACNLRDCDLEDIASSLVKVRKLEAAGCHYITEGAVATTLRQCTSLTSLKLESNSKVTGALCLCPDVGTFSLSALTSLSMAESEGFCDAGLTSVVKRSTQLVDLNVCKCQALGEAALASLAIPTLTRLSVAFLPNLSDAALQRIARCCTNITSLDLAGSYNVGDRALKSVAARLGGIQVLCLSFLDKISDESVEHIAVGCAQLESLSTEQTAITDASLDSLILYSVNLKDLNLAFCHNLSESKIMSCLQQRRLRLLNVSHCRGVSLQTRSEVHTSRTTRWHHREPETDLRTQVVRVFAEVSAPTYLRPPGSG